MKKLKLQVQLSVDGFVAGPNGEMDWMSWNMDAELLKYLTDLTDSVDSIVMGRKMAAGFVGYWQSVVADTSNPQYEFGRKMVDAPKTIFSKTLETLELDNSTLVTGDISHEVNKLKKQEGKDIIAYGGANFVANLIKNNLVDEYHLFVNPTAIGKGMAIFNELEQYLKLKLVKAIAFECGIAVLCYQPA
jgi:dihydrofolate reductase